MDLIFHDILTGAVYAVSRVVESRIKTARAKRAGVYLTGVLKDMNAKIAENTASTGILPEPVTGPGRDPLTDRIREAYASVPASTISHPGFFFPPPPYMVPVPHGKSVEEWIEEFGKPKE